MAIEGKKVKPTNLWALVVDTSRLGATKAIKKLPEEVTINDTKERWKYYNSNIIYTIGVTNRLKEIITPRDGDVLFVYKGSEENLVNKMKDVAIEYHRLSLEQARQDEELMTTEEQE